MAYIKRASVTIAVNGSGDGTGYIDSGDLGGLLQEITYTKAGSGDYGANPTFTITEEDTGKAIITTGAISATTTFAVRRATVSTANAALLYSAGNPVGEMIPIVHRIKIVVAAATASGVGTFSADFV
jgi:hypothetical protein